DLRSPTKPGIGRQGRQGKNGKRIVVGLLKILKKAFAFQQPLFAGFSRRALLGEPKRVKRKNHPTYEFLALFFRVFRAFRGLSCCFWPFVALVQLSLGIVGPQCRIFRFRGKKILHPSVTPGT
ncbi:MAG: hypothetical protein QMD09_13425, partial [Desulfatibacillaceae bacterium]|nr:hypothetical protein [Desulfatibacillaceae bacterium]